MSRINREPTGFIITKLAFLVGTIIFYIKVFKTFHGISRYNFFTMLKQNSMIAFVMASLGKVINIEYAVATAHNNIGIDLTKDLIRFFAHIKIASDF